MDFQNSTLLVMFMIMLLSIQDEVTCNNPTHAHILGSRERQLQCKCPCGLKGGAAYSTKKLLKIREANDDNAEYDVKDNDGIKEDENADEHSLEFDLSEISEKEFLNLMQSGKLQIIRYKEGEGEGEEEERDEGLSFADEIDERSKKRPWRKVARILRRQLIKLPKRYLKKFIRKVGIRRQLRSSAAMPTLITLLPKNEGQVQETETGASTIVAPTNARFGENRFIILNSAGRTMP